MKRHGKYLSVENDTNEKYLYIYEEEEEEQKGKHKYERRNAERNRIAYISSQKTPLLMNCIWKRCRI